MIGGIRESGVIERVFHGKEDHGVWTVVIHLSFQGTGQGFGCLAFKDMAESDDFAAALCRVFGVKTLNALVGLKCEARRCFPFDNIEALVAESGAMFVISEWRKKHYPDTSTVLEAKREALCRRIEGLKRQIKQTQRDLVELEGKYRPVRP